MKMMTQSRQWLGVQSISRTPTLRSHTLPFSHIASHVKSISLINHTCLYLFSFLSCFLQLGLSLALQLPSGLLNSLVFVISPLQNTTHTHTHKEKQHRHNHEISKLGCVSWRSVHCVGWDKLPLPITSPYVCNNLLPETQSSIIRTMT